MLQVVYYLLSTSNHNKQALEEIKDELSIIFFLHQTTTGDTWWHRPRALSIIFFLHQTTTVGVINSIIVRCLLSSFYIKPQPRDANYPDYYVVYYLLSTSNHNFQNVSKDCPYVVYYLLSTSNHNFVG